MFLRNFYDKSRRSIEKPLASGPAAYVFPAGEKRSGSQARLLRILQLQHVEVSRLASAATVDEPEQRNEAGKETGDIAGRRRFPAGSWVVRMDQPYSRIEIGRASCRERVCQYVSISVVAVSLKKK